MRNVPKIVPAQLRRVTVAHGEIHPEAELLTAFTEQALRDSEREKVMEHLTCCGECRDVVALALPASDTVALPDSASGARAWFMPAWLTWPVLRWGVVAAGIALITSLGLVEYNQRTQQSAALISAPSQQEKVEPAPQRPQYSPNAGSGEVLVLRTPQTAQQKVRNPNAARVNRPFPERSLVFSSAPPIIGKGAEQAISGSTPDQVHEQLAQNQMASLPQSQPLNNNNLDVVKAKDSVAPEGELRSGVRWAINSLGALQRSFDGGMTWQDVNVAQTSADSLQMETTAEFKRGATAPDRAKKIRAPEQMNPAAVFRAVTAFGPEVWAGGNAATLYHSLDSGTHWIRIVPLEANVSPMGDILSVEFLDPQHGKFATSAGELWTTSDDGQTWHKQQ